MVRSSSSSEVAVELLVVVDKILVSDTNLSIIPISNAVATTQKTKFTINNKDFYRRFFN
jgi:3-dehydroquinate synthase class II